MTGFKAQKRIGAPWRKYLDGLAPHRAALHRHCCKLCGNVWDAEDLAQDTLMRVFSQLGKEGVVPDNPLAYLVRSATNLWIDGMRKAASEQARVELESRAVRDEQDPSSGAQVGDASRNLLQRLHPQERAALVLKDVLDHSLEETATMLGTSLGAVKNALHRARGRLEERLPSATFEVPDRKLVDAFMQALASKDLATLEKICAIDLTVELVGGAEMTSFERSRSFFKHAHMVLPALGFGRNPRWTLVDYDGEPIIVGLRTLRGIEGVNEVHRLQTRDGTIRRVRTYCFCPDTLRHVAQAIGAPVIERPLAWRSPSLGDVPALLIRYWFGGHR